MSRDTVIPLLPVTFTAAHTSIGAAKSYAPTCELKDKPDVDLGSTMSWSQDESKDVHPQTVTPTDANDSDQAFGILCGTDFSIYACEAADAAAAIAARLKATVTLAHFVEPARSDATSKMRSAMLLNRAFAQLKKETTRLRSKGVKVEQELGSGLPATELVKCALRKSTRLIVLSSLGHIPPVRWLIGSVAEQTVQYSPTPVLIIRDPNPFKKWIFENKPLHMLVGYDFSASADAALDWVANLSKIGPCRLTVANLAPTQAASDCLESDTASGFESSLEETPEFSKNRLAQRCRSRLGRSQFEHEVKLARRDIALRLVDMAKDEDADLIVVGTNQKSKLRRFWLGSVSRGVLRASSRSVACVPLPGSQLK